MCWRVAPRARAATRSRISHRQDPTSSIPGVLDVLDTRPIVQIIDTCERLKIEAHMHDDRTAYILTCVKEGKHSAGAVP